MTRHRAATLPELLAPAGQPDAGYAALEYGADAVYLGLDRFSARAEAVNFTPDELADFVAYAHSLTPRRSVYLTLNTVVQEDELADAAETLFIAAECGVDAVIVQDLGVAALVRRCFPSLRLHASTQMAIHNRRGVLAARELGFERVTLARELTLAEVGAIARDSGMEVETFIHGTLCYSYSGLCLFSSMAVGRSGNRGRCVYTCREAADTPAGRAHPFSLKDMALGERVLDLAAAGVASLKIEGRKKSPLYVAATVDYYRRLLDGRLSPPAAREAEARLKTIFARPWTRLFLDGRRNPDAADPEVVGHRGSPLATAAGMTRTPAGPGLVFRADLPVERHDGIQVDIPGEARPYGFPVDNLYLIRDGGKKSDRALESVFAAPAGALLAVALPGDAPPMTQGLQVYLASSQAVKRSYPFSRPRPGAVDRRLPADIAVAIDLPQAPDGAEEMAATVRCRAVAQPPRIFAAAAPRLDVGADAGDEPLVYELSERVAAFAARDAAGAESAARKAFGRSGDSPFRVDGWRFDNPDGLFLRPGEWNKLRRRLLDGLAAVYAERRSQACAALRAAATSSRAAVTSASPEPPRWLVCVDSPAQLAAFQPDDFAACAEVVVGTGERRSRTFFEALDMVERQVGRERIRLAPPLVNRDDDAFEPLLTRGWRRWLVGGLGDWLPAARRDGMDMVADWPLYALNSMAAERLLDMGFSAFTLSPEDDADNIVALLGRFGAAAQVLAYAEIPLFISAACVHSQLGLCGRTGEAAIAECGAKEIRVEMERSGGTTVYPSGCGSVVVGDKPYSLLNRLDRLRSAGASTFRVDLRWRRRTPAEILSVWRRIREGKALPGNVGNYDRGLA